MTSPKVEDILKTLEAVADPAAPKDAPARDIVSRKMVTGVAVQDGRVSFAITVDPAQGAALEPLRQEAQAAVEKMPGVEHVTAVLTAEHKAPPLNVIGKPQARQAPQHKISGNPVAPEVRYILAVASGKGGVGKSTVAANLALAFHALGKKTGLLDADIYGASQPVMMGLHEKPQLNKKDLIVPPEAHGVKMMSMGFFVEPGAPVVWRGPMVHSAIQQLFRDVDWGKLDVLVVDLPPGTGDAHLSLAQYIPMAGAVIVSTPQDVALNEAVKGLRMFEKTGVPVLGLIENMSYHKCANCGHEDHIFGHGGARKAAEEMKVPFLGEIPLQTAIRERADSGTPITAAEPSHEASEIFKNIAARLWTALPEQKPAQQIKG
ncbi:MAG: P-loop NTPase [Alphaproteobacteria bacterium]|nr:P-loop NTPase [Alphaproteobacteria bacterium]